MTAALSLSWNTSQPAAIVCIQLPALDANRAPSSARNAGTWSVAHRLGGAGPLVASGSVPLDEPTIEQIVARYEREVDRYRKLVDAVEAICTDLVHEHTVHAVVLGRAKDPEHLLRKLRRHADRWDTEAQLFAEIKDLAAVRIATLVEGDRPRIAQLVCDRFEGPHGAAATAFVHDSPGSHYRGTHCEVVIPAGELTSADANLVGLSCEVQVCSLIAMAFNEIQHDLEYKPMTGDLSDDEHRHLAQLAALTADADAVIVDLLRATDARLRSMSGPFADHRDFVARLAPHFGRSRHFATHSRPLYRAVVALGLGNPRALVEEVLSDVSEDEAHFMLHELAEHLASQGSPHPPLDPDTSDPLLVLVLDRRAADLHRVVSETTPASRLAALTAAWLEMCAARDTPI